MPKIRELINFEPIKEVIDIDAISNSKEMWRIMSSLHLWKNISFMSSVICRRAPTAPQIVGYGSGKSHMLAFIISILKQPANPLYSNEKVRSRCRIQRDFVVAPGAAA